MDYSLRELECFHAVAEELSFTRAALRLRLAQPPLSRHVRALEEKLGAQLFERSRRQVVLTPAGRSFYEETRGVLPQLVRGAEAARRSHRGDTDRLRLGFVSAVVSPELVEILRRFRERQPSVQLLLHDVPPAEQIQLLRDGKLDGGFIGLKPLEPTRGIHIQSWRTESLACFLPAGHRLAKKPRIDLKELSSEPFVAVASEAAPAFAAHVRGLCLKAGFRPRIALESPRAQAVAVMVAAGSGVAILPESLARVVGKAAVAVPIAKSPKIVHVFARPAGRSAPALKPLLELLK